MSQYVTFFCQTSSTFCGDSRPSLREDFALEQQLCCRLPLVDAMDKQKGNTHTLAVQQQSLHRLYYTQVVEIPHVAAHWLNECVRKEELVECSNCHVIVTKTSLTTHTKSARCTGEKLTVTSSSWAHTPCVFSSTHSPPVPQKGFVKCPLCHSNVQETDEVYLIALASFDSHLVLLLCRDGVST